MQQRIIKTGGRLVKYARYYWLLLVEGHLNGRRFGALPGPDRAAAGTGGVADTGQVRIGIVLERMGLGVSGGALKVGQNRGAICAVWVRIADQIRALQMKILSHYASRQNRRIVGAVFEVNKEIPRVNE